MGKVVTLVMLGSKPRLLTNYDYSAVQSPYQPKGKIMAINLNNVGSGYKRSVVNSNFTKLEDELNNNVLRRNNLSGGEDNAMQVDIDMNGNQVLNASNVDADKITIAGEEFTDIASLKGDKGDKGDTGDTGATGPVGPQGPAVAIDFAGEWVDRLDVASNEPDVSSYLGQDWAEPIFWEDSPNVWKLKFYNPYSSGRWQYAQAPGFYQTAPVTNALSNGIVVTEPGWIEVPLTPIDGQTVGLNYTAENLSYWWEEEYHLLVPTSTGVAVPEPEDGPIGGVVYRTAQPTPADNPWSDVVPFQVTTGDIDALEIRVSQNETDILANANAIQSNDTGILALEARVAALEGVVEIVGSDTYIKAGGTRILRIDSDGDVYAANELALNQGTV